MQLQLNPWTVSFINDIEEVTRETMAGLGDPPMEDVRFVVAMFALGVVGGEINALRKDVAGYAEEVANRRQAQVAQTAGDYF